MIFPETIEVIITPLHLARASRKTYGKSPLALGLADVLTGCSRIRVTENSVYVYDAAGHPHAARYFVSDDAWKLQERFRAGRTVKPGIFPLKAIYRRDRT